MSDYDKIYSIFTQLAIGVDAYALPTTIKEQIELIKIGVATYNALKDDNITLDEESEKMLNGKGSALDNNERLLLAHCMLLQIYQRISDEFTSMISVSSKDIALKDYQYQAKYKRQKVEDEREIIQQLLLRSDEFGVLD